MKYEIGQIDIPDRQLLATGAPRVSLSKEIGEAQVVHNIFGKARVRIIRKNDDNHRNMWMALLALLLVVVAWLAWVAAQQEQDLPPVESIPAMDESAAASDALPALPLASAEPVAPRQQMTPAVVTIKPQSAPVASVRPPLPQTLNTQVSTVPVSTKPVTPAATPVRSMPPVVASSPSVAPPLAATTLTSDTTARNATADKLPEQPIDTPVK